MAKDLSLVIARQKYSQACQCRSLRGRATLFVEAIAPLMSFDEVDEFAKAEGQWLNKRYPDHETLAIKLDQAGYLMNLKRLLLSAGKNAEPIDRYDDSGRAIGTQLQHRALRWLRPRQPHPSGSTNHFQVNDHRYPIDSQRYLAITQALLGSGKWSDLAVGLIAATGRRPIEILARGYFRATAPDDIEFWERGRGHGNHPGMTIASLLPADRMVSTLQRLRQHPKIVTLLQEAGDDNSAIDRRCNASLNRAVRTHFGELLPPQQGNRRSRINCQGLRAAYAALVVQRDRPNASEVEKMIYAAQQLGSIARGSPVPGDRELSKVLHTLGYMDYRVVGDVPTWTTFDAELPETLSSPLAPANINDPADHPNPSFQPGNTPVEMVPTLKTSMAIPAVELNWLKDYSLEWGCDLSGAICRLVNFYRNHHVDTNRSTPAQKIQPEIITAQILQSVERNAIAIAAISQQLAVLQTAVGPSTSSQYSQSVAGGRHIEKNGHTIQTTQEIPGPPNVTPQQDSQKALSPAPSQNRQPRPKQTETIHDQCNLNQLFGLNGYKLSRTRAASQMRIDRCVRAIFAWNEQSNHKWAINGRAIRDLMPCTIAPGLVSEWLKERREEIAAHHLKHNIEKPTYYNRTHRKQGIQDQIRREVWPLVLSMNS